MGTGGSEQRVGLEAQGIHGVKKVFWNPSADKLLQEALARGEGRQTESGPLAVVTGKYTGRSPHDKFIVRESSSVGEIWWGEVNRPIGEEKFDHLHRKVLTYLQDKEVFVQDCYVGQDPKYCIPLRVITEFAWQNLFARNMFVRITDPETLRTHQPEFTVIAVPRLTADPVIDGTHSEAFILVHFAKKLILIGGTHYAGEIKKSVFSIMNYLLPQQGVLSMHCSANVGPEGDVAIFFGLSGTGKTTLSADPERRLIGDDEHGWSDSGVFNFEGGCYAKLINLSPKAEPEIYATTKKHGTILENVIVNDTGRIDLDDASLTENTRGSYPIDFIPNTVTSGRAGHARNVIMLTCDAFGVLPPVAKLTPQQAEYYFVSGYTSKVAGTERGIVAPQATFSACFGAPFMTLHPTVYMQLLSKKLKKHGANCWLVNTGWAGGAYGTGKRMAIADSRAIIHAILSGELAQIAYVRDPIFGLAMPQACPGLSDVKILNPRHTWSSPAAYDEKARELARLFRANIEKYAAVLSEEIHEAGPVASAA